MKKPYLSFEMTVGITGASGFVGTNLSLYLSEIDNFIIKAIDRQSFITDPVITENGMDVIIHLAGKAHVLKKGVDFHEYYESNFELTKRIYDSFINSAARKFIFISSVKAVADKIDEILTEDQYPNPQTAYGKSKLLAEQYIQQKYLPPGKSYFILRPCMIHGAGNKGNLNLLYSLIEKGIPYPLAGYENKRSFLSVYNLCFVISEIVKNDLISSGIYNVADDLALSTQEVISVLASSLKVKPRLLNISPIIIKLLAKAGDRLHLPLTTERLEKLTENYLVSNQKIKNAINKKLPLTSIQGLKITAESFSKL